MRNANTCRNFFSRIINAHSRPYGTFVLSHPGGCGERDAHDTPPRVHRIVVLMESRIRRRIASATIMTTHRIGRLCEGFAMAAPTKLGLREGGTDQARVLRRRHRPSSGFSRLLKRHCAKSVLNRRRRCGERYAHDTLLCPGGIGERTQQGQPTFVHGLDIFLPFSTSSSPFLIFYRIFSIFPLSFLIFPLPFPSVCYIFHICPSDFGTCLRVDSRLGYVPVCLCVDLDFAPQDLRNVGRYSLPGVWCILRWPSFGVHTLLGVPHAVVAASHVLPRQSASASLAARRCDPAHA